MDDIDLSDVDPLKWAETRRRLAAVREYLALPYASVADRERLAASLNLGAHQFANLVKAWQVSKEASALSPGSRHPERPSRSRQGGVDPVAREIARSEIAKANPDVTLDRLCDAIAAGCRAAKVAPPSRGTVWLLAREARRPSAGTEPDAAIVIGRAFLRLPVDVGTGIVLPEIALAIEMPSARILAATPPGPTSPDARQLGRAVGVAAGGTVLHVDADERDAGPIADTLPACLPVRSIPESRASSMLANTLGGRAGRIGLAFRRPTIRPNALMQSGRDRAPGIEDAAAALRFACQSHNRDAEPAA